MEQPERRICAVCLAEVPRASYTQHMRDTHGYTELRVGISLHKLTAGLQKMQGVYRG
jgi:hypothetical protein